MELFLMLNSLLMFAKINGPAFLKSLPMMVKGMLGIFIVIFIIYIITKVLVKVFPNKTDKEKQK